MCNLIPYAGCKMSKLPKYFLGFCFILLFMVSLPTRTVQAADPAGWGKANVWWPQSNNASSYNIYYKESGEKTYTHAVRNLPHAAMSYTIGYLKSGVTYWYQVAAVDSSGKEYWWSEQKKFWPGASSKVEAKSAATSVRVGGSQSLTKPSTNIAGWTAATASWSWQSQAEYYNVYYREAAEKKYSHAVSHIPSNGTTLKINYLKTGVGYYYNVAAYYGGQEHWLGEKVLVWPMEVVIINDPSFALPSVMKPSTMVYPPSSATMPPPVTETDTSTESSIRDPFATDTLDTLPPTKPSKGTSTY